MIKKLIVGISLSFLAMTTFAAGSSVALDTVHFDPDNKQSLRNGARIFTNYCLSCHSASFMRYNRMAKDLELSDDNVKASMMFTTDKIGDTMTVTMPKDYSAKWFGVTPPDLSLAARSRTPDWLYTFLRGFYLDNTSVTGWNNLVFDHTAMPNVLYELQGSQQAVFKPVTDSHGNESHVFDNFEMQKPGLLTPLEYDQAMTDLVNYLVYVGEPFRADRIKIGIFVMLFLLVLLIPCILLKKEYWRDVH